MAESPPQAGVDVAARSQPIPPFSRRWNLLYSIGLRGRQRFRLLLRGGQARRSLSLTPSNDLALVARFRVRCFGVAANPKQDPLAGTLALGTRGLRAL